jgi:hypothetical protein
MADKHPYIPASGYLVQVINHLRSSFPTAVTADILKKLGFAPKNETYVLNILRFLKVIDQEGNKTESASKIFSQHEDDTFSKSFGKLVMGAYQDLFDLHKDKAWDLDTNALVTFFRSSDETTAIVGKLQASTFKILAAFSGHGSGPELRKNTSKPSASIAKKKTAKSKHTPDEKSETTSPEQTDFGKRSKNIGLAVRIEINLPADGDQDTYDRIFKSIRENLLNE